MGGADVAQLPPPVHEKSFRYFLDVYVDDFIPLAIATSQQQLAHVASAVMKGIHDVFPAHPNPDDDPISQKKLKKDDGQWALNKDLLGFNFNGTPGNKTMQLETPKREFLLAILHKWLRAAQRTRTGIPFSEFESIVFKIQHAFMAIPCGKGLLTPCNKLLSMRPALVYLHHNKLLRRTLRDCHTWLWESTKHPTPCGELVMGEPDFVGLTDASLHGVGGIIVGH